MKTPHPAAGPIARPALLALALMLAIPPAVGRADDPPRPKPTRAAVKIVVTPAGRVAPGTLVKVDLSGSVGTSVRVKGKVPAGSFAWLGAPLNVGYFATPAEGDYTLEATVTLLDFDARVWDEAGDEVTIPVHPAAPPPRPAPVDAPPAPDAPPVANPPAPAAGDPSGMAAATRAVLAPLAGKWSTDALAFRRGPLADAFAAQGLAVATAPSLQAAVNQAGAAIEGAVGAAAWPGWKASLVGPVRAQLAARVQSAAIATPAQFGQALADVAAALKE